MVFRNYLMLGLVSLTALSGCSSEAAETHAQPTITEDCKAYSGWEAVAAKAQMHIILFGEMHGTEQSPSAARGLICELVTSGMPVRLGIETLSPLNKRLDATLTQPMDKSNVRAAAERYWAERGGHNSAAMYKLFEDVARWRAGGSDIGVFGITGSDGSDASKSLGNGELMARNVDSAAHSFGGAVIVIVGGGHVVLNLPGSGRTGGSLATELKSRPPLSLQMKWQSGTVWNMMYNGNGEAVPPPQSLPGNDKSAVQGERFLLDDSSGYESGYYYTGPITASPPAFPDE